MNIFARSLGGLYGDRVALLVPFTAPEAGTESAELGAIERSSMAAE